MINKKFNQACFEIRKPLLFSIFFILLTACQGGNPSVTGKWESISGSTSIAGTGSVLEFFPDGTVTIDGRGTSYSWPDSKHIKIGGNEGAGSAVFEYVVANEEFTLSTSQGETLVLKKYEELPLSTSALLGTWLVLFHQEFQDNPCLEPIGLKQHGRMSFREDGTVSIEILTSLGDKGALSGHFTTSGNFLRMSLSGKVSTVGLLGLSSTEEVRGDTECSIAKISHSRFVLDKGAEEGIVYVRETQ